MYIFITRYIYVSICISLYLYISRVNPTNEVWIGLTLTDLWPQVEEGADQQLRQQHGERWACVRSAALTVESRRELAEVQTLVKQNEET